MTKPIDQTQLIQALSDLIGAEHIISDTEVCKSYITDWSGEAGDLPLAVVRPKTTSDLSKILAYCNQHQCAVVPQGGLTGLAGGATIRGAAIALSLEHLKGVIELDTESATLTAWAGTPLETLQQAAADAGYLLALDLGARGSCQIGGNVATNAGGNRVIRYGMARDLVLGLEVVLADGTVLPMLNKMTKNNAGFDLKQLFIGSEGTLGVITQVVLKLHPKVSGANTALLALTDFQAVVKLLRYSQQRLSNLVSAFEVMWQDYYVAATTVGGQRAPLGSDYPIYVLMDLQSDDPDGNADNFQSMLEHAWEQGWVMDAAVAQSQGDVDDFWNLRDAISELLTHYAPIINFDMSFPIAHIGEAVDQLKAHLHQHYPDLTTLFFGHVGDSNIHLCTGPIPNNDKAIEHAIEKHCYEIAQRFNGSVSAEHGIGLHKKPWLSYSRSAEEITLMRTLKNSLDPNHILNPGKVLP